MPAPSPTGHRRRPPHGSPTPARPGTPAAQSCPRLVPHAGPAPGSHPRQPSQGAGRARRIPRGGPSAAPRVPASGKSANTGTIPTLHRASAHRTSRGPRPATGDVWQALLRAWRDLLGEFRACGPAIVNGLPDEDLEGPEVKGLKPPQCARTTT
jgi:hypothetical protein